MKAPLHRLCQTATLLIMALISCQVIALDSTQVHKKVSESIYLIISYNIKNNKAEPTKFGSGVAMTKQIIVTNCHVALSAKYIAIKINENYHNLNTHSVNKPHDLCLLILKKPLLIPVKIRTYSNVTVGEKVYAIGYPRGINRFLSEGIVSNKTIDENGIWILSDVATGFGSSGGGLFDNQGNLIDITTAGLKKFPNITVSAATDWIANKLSLSSGAVPQKKTPDSSIKKPYRPTQPKKIGSLTKIGVFGDNKIALYKKGKFCFIYFPGRNADGISRGAAIWSYKNKRMLMIFPKADSINTTLKTLQNEFSSSQSNPKSFNTKHHLYLDKKWFNLHTVRHPNNNHLIISYFKGNPSHLFINENRFVIYMKHPRHKKRYNTITFGLWGFTDAYMAYRKHCKK